MNNRIWELEQSVSGGEIDLSNVSDIDTETPSIKEGFDDFEEMDESRPTGQPESGETVE